MIRVVKRNDLTFFRTTEEVKKNKLYIPGWFFESLLHEYQDNIKQISLVYHNEVPVAVAMVWDYPEEYGIDGEQIGCFVKPAFRRQGFGTAAVRALGGTEGREWRIGEENSGLFWTGIENDEAVA